MLKLTITYQYQLNRKTDIENCISIEVPSSIYHEVNYAVSVSEKTMSKLLRLCKSLVAIEGGVESTTTITQLEAHNIVSGEFI